LPQPDKADRANTLDRTMTALRMTVATLCSPGEFIAA
jgi:hypothetical protein